MHKFKIPKNIDIKLKKTLFEFEVNALVSEMILNYFEYARSVY